MFPVNDRIRRYGIEFTATLLLMTGLIWKWMALETNPKYLLDFSQPDTLCLERSVSILTVTKPPTTKSSRGALYLPLKPRLSRGL